MSLCSQLQSVSLENYQLCYTLIYCKISQEAKLVCGNIFKNGDNSVKIGKTSNFWKPKDFALYLNFVIFSHSFFSDSHMSNGWIFNYGSASGFMFVTGKKRLIQVGVKPFTNLKLAPEMNLAKKRQNTSLTQWHK